jgi:hypothetical protein
MNYISLISGLVKLASKIADWLERSRLINQGRKEQVNESLKVWKEEVERASLARRTVKSDADSLRDDPDRRD